MSKSSPAEKAKWQGLKDTAKSDFTSHRYVFVSTPKGSHISRKERKSGRMPNVVTGRTAVRSSEHPHDPSLRGDGK